MDKLIMSAQQLHIPEVTGQVSISLKEIDNLRAAHAQAIKIAQKLENEQKLVKVEIWGQGNYMDYNPSNHQYKSVTKDQIKDVKFVNMEDIMTELTEAASEQVAKAHATEISTLKRANNKLSGELVSATERGTKLRAEIQETKAVNVELQTTVKDLEAQVETLTKEVNSLQVSIDTKWEPMQEKYTDLIDSWNELRKEKTFWGWFTNLFK